MTNKEKRSMYKEISNFIIYKKKEKWVVEHRYTPAIYKKTFRFKFIALWKKNLLDSRKI